ncbi:MAG: hypothetical protein ACRD29_02655 [Acidimicrobiales bacterium]
MGWDLPAPVRANVGAVTRCGGVGACVGAIGEANSFVGSTAGDQVGFGGVFVLTGGEVVVHSPNWDGPPNVDVGAVTFCAATSSDSRTPAVQR